MSWSASTSCSVADVVESLDGLSETPPSSASEQSSQVVAAKAAAQSLVLSGAVTNASNQNVYISISGHANSGHTPTAGYASDVVTVSVSQAPSTTGNN